MSEEHTTLSLSKDEAKKLRWLLTHEEEIEKALDLSRDVRSMARVSRLFWAIVLGFASLIGAIGGLLVLFRKQ